MGDKPKISIITVVFNAERLIQRTLESIAAQTYENIEYIVIDGKSKDTTMDVINRYSSVISKIVSEPDKGIYDAMNKGLLLATGEYVWFINAGDYIVSKDIVSSVFDEHAGADVYYGKINIVAEDGRIKTTTPIPRKLTYKSFVKGMVVSHQGLIFRKSLTGPYDLRYNVVADHDWIINALRKSRDICRVDKALVNYLAGGVSEQRFGICWKERFAIILRQYGLLSFWINHLYFLRDYVKREIKKFLKYR